jgi:hypothetical protein
MDSTRAFPGQALVRWVPEVHDAEGYFAASDALTQHVARRRERLAASESIYLVKEQLVCREPELVRIAAARVAWRFRVRLRVRVAESVGRRPARAFSIQASMSSAMKRTAPARRPAQDARHPAHLLAVLPLRPGRTRHGNQC